MATFLLYEHLVNNGGTNVPFLGTWTDELDGDLKLYLRDLNTATVLWTEALDGDLIDERTI